MTVNTGAVVQNESLVDQRDEIRRRTLLVGKIVYGQDNQVTDCIIRDLTESGARVAVSSPGSIPDKLTLVESKNFSAYEARVAWRRDKLLGLSFDQTLFLNSKEAILLYLLRNLAVEMQDRSKRMAMHSSSGAAH
jgi:hypothetical protein